MAAYYINKNAQSNGDHEVHKSGCSFMPNSENRRYLGDFSSCRPAVVAAKKIYPTPQSSIAHQEKSEDPRKLLLDASERLNHISSTPPG